MQETTTNTTTFFKEVFRLVRLDLNTQILCSDGSLPADLVNTFLVFIANSSYEMKSFSQPELELSMLPKSRFYDLFCKAIIMSTERFPETYEMKGTVRPMLHASTSITIYEY